VLNINSLDFDGLGKLSLRVNSTSPGIVTTSLNADGAASSVVVDAANTGAWTTGQTYNLVSYSGSITGTGFGAFIKGTVNGLGPRQSATLTNPSGFIALSIGGDNALWTGLVNGNWTTNTIAPPKNWKTQTGGVQTDFLVNDSVVFDDTAAGTTNVVVSDANVPTASVLLNNSTKNYTFSGAFGISSGIITKNGTGTLTINNANTYAGGTLLNAGQINVNNASAIGTGALTIAGGTLNNTSGGAVTLTTNNAQSWNGDFTFTGSNDLDLGNGNITLGGAGTSRTVTVSAGTLGVGIMTTGTGLGLTKQGNGTLQFSAVSNATHNILGGDLVINAGTVNIGARDLDVTGLSGAGTLGNGSATTRWLYITNTSNYTFSGAMVNGAGGGALGLNKNGTGTLTISGANSYTDTTTVNAGTLIISGNNSGAGTNPIVNTGNLVLANTNTLGTTSLIRLAGVNVSTLTFASDADGTAYNVTMGTGTQAAIVSDRATPGPGVNHTIAMQSLINGLGGGTLNFTSGPNVTSGIGRITYTQLGLGAGSVQTTLLNPTTANVTITGTVRKENNNVAQTLELGGTTTDNFINGAISNGPPLTGANTISLTKSNSSTWTINGANTYTGATTVSGGKLVVGASIIGTSGLTMTGSTLDMTAAGTGMIRTNALSIDGSSKLDLGRNKMIVVGGTLGTHVGGGVYDGISGYVDTGRNGGNWNGASGIITSQSNALPAQNVTNIAVAAAGDIGKTTFGGQAVAGTDILVMYTYNGDANLSANVDADDYFIIDSNYNKSGTVFGYSKGDFNYDGVINGDDFALIDAGFSGQGAVPILPGAPVGELAGVTAVPEPSTLSLLALGGAALLRRRRRS
jgi:autotransporter-associated beta strand protein